MSTILAGPAGGRGASAAWGPEILCESCVELLQSRVAVWQAHRMTDLPPLDQAQAYVVVGPNDQRGPYTMELLIDEVVAGRLSDSTPVWWPALTDWTTLSAHPGVAGEIARRRGAPAPAPEWATPTPAPPAPAAYAPPAPAQVYEQPQPEPVPSAYSPAPAPEAAAYAAPGASPYAAPVEPAVAAPAAAAGVADPFASSAVVEQAPFVPLASEPVAAEVVEVVDVTDVVDEDGIVVAEVVEVTDVTDLVDADGVVVAEVVEVGQAVAVDPGALANYTALVVRSSVRADAQMRIDSVDEELVTAVIGTARKLDFDLDDRVDVDRGHELRFGEAGGDLLVISLGRIGSIRPEDIVSDHVPVTVSYRSGAYEGAIEPGEGNHGEVEVVADEWTGQATSSVSLLLSLEDYVDPDLAVDEAAVARDVGATIAIVRGRLS